MGVSDYAKLPVSRLAALGTAFESLAAAVQTAVNGAGGSGYVRCCPFIAAAG